MRHLLLRNPENALVEVHRSSGSRELERLKRVYADRDQCSSDSSLVDSGDLFMAAERQLAVVQMLRCAGVRRFEGVRILDVGCGAGGTLAQFLFLGASSQNLFGVDIVFRRLRKASLSFPGLKWACGAVQQLPFGDSSFDLVCQFTAFSSILDREVQTSMAAEMLRVLTPKGVVLWYDFFYDNPHNPDVRGIGKRTLLSFFPHCSVWLKRVTLAPPLSRALAPKSYLLCSCLSALRFLNTHYLAIIRRDG